MKMLLDLALQSNIVFLKAQLTRTEWRKWRFADFIKPVIKRDEQPYFLNLYTFQNIENKLFVEV